ncbi:uncharacterized protein LOC128162279 [Crassostrea angulata]|uniref:uncharacterized protein LOC128162279 n=1 Tax=Magallana angulata TaxID=2784310 RepID=UPI0022B08C0E|nr:uncharacterized protein LOC128162279 [Crassostrea angulata]
MEKVSESVFVGMCQIVGTSQQIAIRRASVGLSEIVQKGVANNDINIIMMSGSHREGFRMVGSDIDYMIWPNNHRVILDLSQSEFYNTAITTLILSDNSESPPGFTLLQLLTPRTNALVLSTLVRMNDNVYISSSRHRQETLSNPFPNSTIHGPCSSGVVIGVNYDIAHCYVCDVWPTYALSWKERCHSWPNPYVVDDILKSECHFVAIGHPLGLHENEEWRISFSQAEYKCVQAMNHCQFLTYGLLKLFLKEVINEQSEETSQLLCSYHIKTAVFWAIQQNTLLKWCPQNLLVGFWSCFKLLLKWVYEGICPNFFIPQNNLFLAKVYGSIQIILFLQLQELYKKGLTCLLQSSTIRSHIINVLYNPILLICIDENVISDEIKNDAEHINEFLIPLRLKAPCSYIKAIQIIEHLVYSSLTHYEFASLQRLTVIIIQCTAFYLYNMSANKSVNKQLYIFDKIACHILKFAAKFGCISDPLYIAMYYYNSLRYKEAASVIKMTKIRHIDTTLSQAALDELQILVHHDQGDIPLQDSISLRSWTILDF